MPSTAVDRGMKSQPFRLPMEISQVIAMVVRTFCIAIILGSLGAARSVAAEPEYVIQIKDHQFVPASLTIPSGVKVSIVLDNQDDTPEEFDSHSLNREKHIPPKSRVTIFIGPLEPGRYLYEGENDGRPGGPALGVIVVQ